MSVIMPDGSLQMPVVLGLVRMVWGGGGGGGGRLCADVGVSKGCVEVTSTYRCQLEVTFVLLLQPIRVVRRGPLFYSVVRM